MQSKINSIIFDEKITKFEKIKKLKNFFQENNVIFFSDFDDTITNYKDIFFTKIKLIKNDENKYIEILENFTINNKFLDLLKINRINEIFILSRNSHEFIEFFIKKNRGIFNEKWINILWWIGTTKSFKLNTSDKILLLSKKSFIISDIFEYNRLKSQSNLLLIDNFSYIKLFKTIVVKFFYLIKFIIKNV